MSRHITHGPATSTGSQSDRLGMRHMVFAGILVLVAISPFGDDASRPIMFLTYRTLLVAVTLCCYWSLKGSPASDFPLGVYVLGIAILALMALSAWSAPGSDSTGWTVWSEHLLFGLFFVSYARYSARQPETWKKRLVGALIGVTLAHLVFRLSAGPQPGLGLFANTNYFAAYLLVGFASAAALTLYLTDVRWRILAGACTATLFYGITESLSRGATLAALGVVLLALWLHKGKPAVAGIGVLALLGGLAIAAFNPDLVRRFTDRGEVDPFNYQRVEIWGSTANLIADQPILGVGPAQYEHVARRYRFPVEGTIGRFMKRASSAHSEYLHYAAEAGTPAALLIVGLLAYFLWLLVGRRTPIPGDPHRKLFPMDRVGLFVLFSVCLHALVDNVFQVSVVTAVMAAVALGKGPLTDIRRVPGPAAARGMTLVAGIVTTVFFGSTLLPGLAYGLNATGHRRLGEHRFEDAILAYRSAVALRPNDARLLTDLGLAYQEQYLATNDLAFLDTAEAYLSRARAVHPTSLLPRQGYADALVLRLSGNASDDWIHERLVEAYRDILGLDPFLPRVRHNLAEALYRSGHAEEAFRELELTLTLEPNFVPGYRTLAGWYGQNGDGRSRRLLEQAETIVERYRAEDRLTAYEAALLGRSDQTEAITR